ncbi:MAG: hypothetical protein EOP08_14865, partial [Proteobacteria bacterium]
MRTHRTLSLFAPASLATLALAVACGLRVPEGDGPTSSDPGRTPVGDVPPGGTPPPGVAGQPGSAVGSTGIENGGLGTDWHLDPDGDDVPTPKDKCPYIYDPAQAD